MNKSTKELDKVWTKFLSCYRSINDGFREFQYDLDNKTTKFTTFYNDTNPVLEDDPNDEIFINNLMDNVFYFYYNSWNILKKKFLKDLVNINQWLKNNNIKKNNTVTQLPTYIDFTNIFILINDSLEALYSHEINITENNTPNYFKNFKYHNHLAWIERLKRTINFHNNIWVHFNNNLLDELRFYNVNVEKETITYFNNLDIKLNKKQNIKKIKKMKMRDCIQKTKLLENKISKLKKENEILISSSQSNEN